ncbi:DUF2779 domain-containing protein [Trinickia violacea]|uniref:DUF2779 domain-containing protein n=1 Tax=Trinickia violacea TaxID=2571746 RepID=A0A4P8IJP0_9BURK|nr:DUF2779 domain-containing protein [Trinickia violacea]QCP47877.1 DUF2779 domain-containing protein [Trinickia violacea]
MRTLSKSKLIAFRQCPNRLWLELHRSELCEDSDATQVSFQVGHEVGEIARRLYDSKQNGVLIDAQQEGFDSAFACSRALLGTAQPIFEAGYSAGGALAFADVMLPEGTPGMRSWRMIEVKSTTRVKDYQRDDVAIQAFVARSAGVPLSSVAVAHIDSGWTYPGAQDYEGLLTEHDLTDDAFARTDEVQGWIANAHAVARQAREPDRQTGQHCLDPYECGFLGYCQSGEPQPEYPVQWLPRVGTKPLKSLIEDGFADMREVPDDLLNERQLRVKSHALSGRTFFDAAGAIADLAGHKLPAYFLDFETIQFAVPIWKGTRPYQQIPFQFSAHRLSRTGKLEHQAFLDVSGDDPSRAFAQALIAGCGECGPVFVYNAGFETTRIRELADRFPRLATSLLAIRDRIVDLLPIAQDRYYHPSQQGSWSIKRVLPAVAPDLRYDALDEVQDGGMAMRAYQEAIHPGTARARKEQIEQQLLDYCGLDTFAMVRLWQFLAGCHDLEL